MKRKQPLWFPVFVFALALTGAGCADLRTVAYCLAVQHDPGRKCN